MVVLRTSRFFPEADDMAHAIRQSDANTKANELLFRRLTVEDAARAHLLALDRAPDLGFDLFIVSAPPPFSPEDAEALIADAPGVVARCFPRYPGSTPVAAGRCSTASTASATRPGRRRGWGSSAGPPSPTCWRGWRLSA